MFSDASKALVQMFTPPFRTVLLKSVGLALLLLIMLGIGLHSYGFMSGAFLWLGGFVLSQLLLVGFGCLPQRKWLSFKARGTGTPAPPSSHKSRKRQPVAA